MNLWEDDGESRGKGVLDDAGFDDQQVLELEVIMGLSQGEYLINSFVALILSSNATFIVVRLSSCSCLRSSAGTGSQCNTAVQGDWQDRSIDNRVEPNIQGTRGAGH